MQAARALEGLGAIVEDVAFDASDLKDIIAGTRAFAMVARFGELVEAHGARMAEALVRQVTAARAFDVKAVARAERMRSAYYQRLRVLLERYDHVLTPTAGVPAFRIDRPLPTEIGGRPVERFYDTFLFTYAFSVTGLPAISVPCGFTGSGLPVGLQIVGPAAARGLGARSGGGAGGRGARPLPPATAGPAAAPRATSTKSSARPASA